MPVEDDLVELMEIKISNVGEETVEFIPTAAIPIYGRSADNLRDHRHVTSLLNRIITNDYGVIVKPTLLFDERGHKRIILPMRFLGVKARVWNLLVFIQSWRTL